MNALYSVGRTVPLERVLRAHRTVLLPLAIALVVNLVVLIAVVLPLSQRVSTSEQRAVAAERQRVAAEAEFKQAGTLRGAKAQASEDLETFYSQVLPAGTSPARRLLQLKLHQQARAHNVQYQSGGTTEEQLRQSNLLRLTMQLRLSGEYADIRRFIYELETSPDFVIIDNVKLAEEAGRDSSLAVFLDVSTYYRTSTGPTEPTTGDGR